MKKLMYGLMAAGLSLGLAAPSFAAMAPSVQGSSQIVKVQSTTKKAPAKKTATKKAPTKKTATKKAPAKKKSS